MFKEPIKYLSVPALAILMSCGGNQVADKARSLYDHAMQLRDQGRYDEAIKMLDSIDHAYPAATEVRRLGLRTRPVLMEQLTSRQLEVADSIAAEDSFRLDSLSRQLQMVPNPIEGYFVPRSEGHVDVSVSGLHARMSPDGRFYIVASSPSHIAMTSITVSCNGESASTPAVAFDGERNDRSGSTDVITFIEAESSEVGDFILRHRNSPVTVTYSGKSTVSRPLSDVQKHGIATLSEAASLIRDRKVQELERQRLERLLQAIRSQIARTTPDSVSADQTNASKD